MKSKAYCVFLLTTLIFTACEKFSEKDQSLTKKEFTEMGMPDPSKIWNFKDYSDACKLLDNLKVFKPYSLPKKESKKSSMYFERIINPENFSFLQDETLPLYERANQIQQYVDIQGLLINIYTDMTNAEQYYNRELIDLYIFGLTIAQHMLDLGQMINESINEEDISMQYGFRSIQFMYIKMVLFVLENQKKKNLFEETDLEKLTDFIVSSLSLNKDWMEAAAVEDIKQDIQQVINNTSSEHIIYKYNKLIGEL